MLGSANIVAIIGTTRGDASRQFYQDTLGLTFVRDDGYAFLFDVDGKELRVSRVPAVVPATYATMGFHVKDIAAEVDALAARGVKFERFGFFQQDARGVWAAPDGTQVAWFRDPDLNMLSLVQHA